MVSLLCLSGVYTCFLCFPLHPRDVEPNYLKINVEKMDVFFHCERVRRVSVTLSAPSSLRIYPSPLRATQTSVNRAHEVEMWVKLSYERNLLSTSYQQLAWPFVRACGMCWLPPLNHLSSGSLYVFWPTLYKHPYIFIRENRFHPATLTWIPIFPKVLSDSRITNT